ncbi:NTP pyrophosphohydrolase [Hahella sp. CCB-MM4]|nr:NTP pyrophosphohydrolase [Hahella sp. CCB-MM4]
MIRFDKGNNRFNFRSAAVVCHSDHVLLHRAVSDDFWALPGGRVEFFETSEDTIVRELREELGVESSIDRHLWYVENFFNYKGTKFHEVANYFLASFKCEPQVSTEVDFAGIEKDVDLIFRWVPIAKLGEYVLKPEFLIAGIQNLPTSVEYIKFNELGSEM